MKMQRISTQFEHHVHNIFCILDKSMEGKCHEQVQQEFKRVGLDEKVIFYFVPNGSIHNEYTYFLAIQNICKMASVLQNDKPQIPIAIFKGNIIFIDHNFSQLVRVATALNIYQKSFDIFNLSCEYAIYIKELLGRDVFRGSAQGNYSIIISPTIVTELACKKYKHITSMTEFVGKYCKQQLLLANPICYQPEIYDISKYLTRSELSAYVWYTIGKFLPYKCVQEYFYWNMITTHDL